MTANIPPVSLIPDEVRPLILSMGPLRDLMTYVREDIIHTPGSFVIIYAWQNVFGNTDVAAKMFALVVGAGILAAFGVLARRVTSQWIRPTVFADRPPIRRPPPAAISAAGA